MFFKVLVEEKRPQPKIQEPTKKLSTKPDETHAVPTEEPPKKGINSLFVSRAFFVIPFIIKLSYSKNCLK